MEQQRCKGKLVSGDQCSRDAAKGSDLCNLCADNSDRNIYDLAVDSERIQQLASHKHSATLNAEEAMTRRLLEILWKDSTQNGTQVLQLNDLSRMLAAVKDMVIANHNLKKSRKSYLDETQVNMVGEEFLDALNAAVTTHVKDEETQQKILRAVGERVVKTIKNLGV